MSSNAGPRRGARQQVGLQPMNRCLQIPVVWCLRSIATLAASLYAAVGIGVAPEGGSASADIRTSHMEWKTHENRALRFRILYPSSFEVVDVKMAPRHNGVAPIGEIHFRARSGAHGTDAPPRLADLTVRVYAREPPLALGDWLRHHRLVATGARWRTEPWSSTRGRTGIRVYSENLLAPGWSVYTTGDHIVYELVPLGPVAERMLDTFTVLP